jgi:hypothetical protein
MIEVIDDQASLYVDNRKVISTLIDNEINRSGRIALEKFWKVPAEFTFSYILIIAFLSRDALALNYLDMNGNQTRLAGWSR